MYETKFENGVEITSYDASFIVAFSDTASDKDQIKAWSFLIGSGEAERVKGWYKKHADNLITVGLISKDGVINWDKFDAFTSGKTTIKAMKVDAKSTAKEKTVKVKDEPIITFKGKKK